MKFFKTALLAFLFASFSWVMYAAWSQILDTPNDRVYYDGFTRIEVKTSTAETGPEYLFNTVFCNLHTYEVTKTGNKTEYKLYFNN